jgi:hypothetical protein
MESLDERLAIVGMRLAVIGSTTAAFVVLATGIAQVAAPQASRPLQLIGSLFGLALSSWWYRRVGRRWERFGHEPPAAEGADPWPPAWLLDTEDAEPLNSPNVEGSLSFRRGSVH